MNQFSTSLILIGMPGAGKSTIGVLLAKALAKDFVDTDVLIQLQEEKTLQDIVDTQGYLKLRAIEEQVLLNTHYPNHVIATGGSAVYSEKAMHHLRHFGQIVFLDLPLAELSKRIKDFDTRGLARKPDQSLAELYSERRKLYQSYANITIDCLGKKPDDILAEIIYEEAEAYTEKDA
ncbi:shikimate kinase [Cellvibrio zantedeschiae]|uniref:Shikimate kinase n=1 Tax=Cellvibrio zantedeschiae TaxID=1237077 RepID=A0ABQ3B038_9GAMM|nr:shikimate kinase [Cellvibrio zantedeschiae]GGY72242.1 shikimate kinase [Cellvibrio zantedeschiae]